LATFPYLEKLSMPTTLCPLAALFEDHEVCERSADDSLGDLPKEEQAFRASTVGKLPLLRRDAAMTGPRSHNHAHQDKNGSLSRRGLPTRRRISYSGHVALSPEELHAHGAVETPVR
jgi:hypothetical protein